MTHVKVLTGIALLGILFLYLLIFGPMNIETGVQIDVPPPWQSQQAVAISPSPAPNNPWQDEDRVNGRWKDRSYNDGTENPLGHIHKQHRYNSMSPNKSKFLKQYSQRKDLYTLGNTVYKEGTWHFSKTKNLWEVVYNSRKAVGYTFRGQPTNQVKMLVDELGNVLTMFPL